MRKPNRHPTIHLAKPRPIPFWTAPLRFKSSSVRLAKKWNNMNVRTVSLYSLLFDIVSPEAHANNRNRKYIFPKANKPMKYSNFSYFIGILLHIDSSFRAIVSMQINRPIWCRDARIFSRQAMRTTTSRISNFVNPMQTWSVVGITYPESYSGAALHAFRALCHCLNVLERVFNCKHCLLKREGECWQPSDRIHQMFMMEVLPMKMIGKHPPPIRFLCESVL